MNITHTSRPRKIEPTYRINSATQSSYDATTYHEPQAQVSVSNGLTLFLSVDEMQELVTCLQDAARDLAADIEHGATARFLAEHPNHRAL